MKRVCYSVVLSLLSLPAYAQTCASMEPMEWILGEWQAQQGENVVFEEWTQVSAGTFEGKGGRITGGSNEEEISEALRLVLMMGDVFYIAKPVQNPLPTAFKLKECSKDSAVFENMLHDFPKRLVYMPRGIDSLVVHVSDGAENGFSIRFGKKNP